VARPLTETVRFGHVANPFSRPVDVALERGYFADEGIALEVARYANGSGTADALAAGEIDLGVGGHIQTLQATLAGDPQVFLAPLGFEQSPHHLVIAVVAGAGASSGRDLEGATVGVSARAAISELQLRIFMELEGADYASVKLSPMPFSELGAALARGDIAAASAPDPLASQLEQDGLGRVIDRGSLSRALPAGEWVMITGLAATPKWIDEDPARARRIVKAIERAVDDLSGDSQPNTPRFDRVLRPVDLQRVFDLALQHGLIDRAASAPDLIRSL